MIFPFPQSIGANFTFNPVLNGTTYQATVTWNIFGQRWYLNLYDLSGNLLLCTAVVSSDDQQAISSISWDDGIVTVTTLLAHFLELGTTVRLMISGNTPDAFNGVFLCDVTGPNTFTYPLVNDPGQQVVIGAFGGIIDLSAGMFPGSTLTYYNNDNQFVTSP